MDFDQLFICLYCFFTIVRLTTGEDCKLKDFCSCETTQGIVDLHALANNPKNPRFTVSGGNYVYDFEPCKSLELPCDGAQSGVSVCQRTNKGSNESFVAGFTNTAKFSGVPFDKNNLNLTFTSEVLGVLRTSVFHIVCADTEGELVSGKEDPNHKGTYLFELKTKYACLNSGGNDDNNKKISAGSVLLILFFSLIFLYFVVGIIYLKYAGAQGTEMIPNYEFWTSLPGYIKDGFVFTCRGCKKESSYSQI